MHPLWKVALPPILALPLLIGTQPPSDVHAFPKPIDALSIQMNPGDQVQVRGETDQGWTAWQTFTIEDDNDPLSHESNLVMFSAPVSAVEFDHTVAENALQPITVSHAPIKYDIASLTDPGTPHILTRAQWGADNSLLYTSQPSSSSSDNTDNQAEATDPLIQTSQRVADCLQAQNQYPQEFKTTGKTVTNDGNGNLRWPDQYSPSIKLLVVHHTAIANTGQTRSGVDEVRAIYQYQAIARGWGDIGYHYLIDQNGQIYEGKAGGLYVVGGHAYCNNIGTIGIVMLGNFDIEDPTQAQVHSLQWLLHDLAGVYHIDLSKQVEYHGVMRDPIVGHRDLLSTDCPGYFLYGALAQVKSNVRADNLLADVSFPAPPDQIASDKAYVDQTAARRAARIAEMKKEGLPLNTSAQSTTPAITTGVSALGSTMLAGRPGDQMIVSMRYKAPSSPPAKGSSIATVNMSDGSMQLWEDIGGTFEPVQDHLVLPTAVPANGTTQIRLKLQFPLNPGPQTMRIDQTDYSVVASGRRQLGPRGSETLPNDLILHAQQRAAQRRAQIAIGSQQSSSPATPILTAAAHSSQPAQMPASPSSSVSQIENLRSSVPNPNPPPNPIIRILLGYQGPTAMVMPPDGAAVTFSQNGSDCVGTQNGRVIGQGIVRVNGGNGLLNITSWSKTYHTYRGVIECRILNGQLSLINELPLESYMAGLGEEPDSQPYEKQRAFAVAARTYAAYYLSPDHRKIPGAPYDGTDSAAVFQRYEGAGFETSNPNWVKAVASTSEEVLTKDDQLIKPPYFSADGGQTKSPAQAGWNNFPFAEIFTSKPDPWCQGMTPNGHGVGMSGCGAAGQAKAGKTAEQILSYYYPTTTLTSLNQQLTMR
ncbi:MAG TPA: N-acetylmuramoyl-L-alanine amidase [Candidatus Peribacteraceae bacterium]|nr:N-acetylmuramoyl-L-alanine amidase [Candidatus Peribacteraceae bacterium]